MAAETGAGARLALIGFGEVGQTFARELLARPGVSIAAYDILFDDAARGPAMLARAREAGVAAGRDAAAAGESAEFVISAVTAASAADVAREAATWLRAGQIVLDLNSVSPATKRDAARAVEAAGADYVEAAVMAPVPGAGLSVPILLAGRRAEEIAPRLRAFGMNVTPVASEIGRASATKLCRSIIIKGLEALMVDCTLACEHFDVSHDVFASLEKTFPGADWAKLSASMLGRVRQHGARRAAEMREAAAMLDEIGLAPSLVREVSRHHDLFAGSEMIGPDRGNARKS